MDTSDSEAFESADENFDDSNVSSDDEDNTVAPRTIPSKSDSSDEEQETVAQNPQLILSDILQNITELQSDKQKVDEVKHVTSVIQSLKLEEEVEPEASGSGKSIVKEEEFKSDVTEKAKEDQSSQTKDDMAGTGKSLMQEQIQKSSEGSLKPSLFEDRGLTTSKLVEKAKEEKKDLEKPSEDTFKRSLSEECGLTKPTVLEQAKEDQISSIPEKTAIKAKDEQPSDFSEKPTIKTKEEIIVASGVKDESKLKISNDLKLISQETQVLDIPDEVGSGWDDDVEWIAIEDPKPEVLRPEPIPTDSGSGWDDFDDDWDEKPPTKPEESESGSGWDEFDNWDSIEEPVESVPKVQPVLDKLSQAKSSWGSWGAWDVTSVLSAATESVSKLTSVIETGIGAPSPEEMAQIQQTVEPTEPETPLFGNLLSGVNRVVTTGLDTLEVIGKKTMEVLQEGDPRLEKKRNLLGLTTDKPCLSQVLREAKEKASQDPPSEQKSPVRQIHFESLFDDYQGLVHLEALEMLSKQCDIKLSTTVDSLEGSNLEEFQETMLQVKELCELPDEEEDEQLSWDEVKSKLQTVVEELNIQISFEKLLGIWVEVEGEMKQIENEVEVHRKAIDTLAKITSAGVEQFHKCAELLLVKERRSTADEADSLVQLTTTLTALIGLVAAKFSEKLDSLGSGNDNPDLNDLITNVFFEATQSSSYVQDAFQLFVPILQIGAV